MRLINAQDQEVQPGMRLRVVEGKESGQAWTFSHVVEHPVDGHRVHVTRRHPRMGHVHREFHPRLFGLHVVIDMTWRQSARVRVHHIRTKVDDYILAGIFALIPLAVFEQFHLSEHMFEILGLGR